MKQVITIKQQNILFSPFSKESMFSARCNKNCQQCLACNTKTHTFPVCKKACEKCNICSFSKNYPHNNATLSLTQKPKLIFDKKSGIIHKIKDYPPNIYWYHNPIECEDTCDPRICQIYKKQLFDYRMCRECKRQDPSKCWSKSQFKCISCPSNETYKSCKKLHGCSNPNGSMHRNTIPINPKYNNCQLCKM